MENKKKFQKLPVLSLVKQGELIKQTYPTFQWKINEGGELICTGILQPTELSKAYKVKISYKVGKQPIIKIVSPEIVGEKIPHMYNNQGLCLYKPDYKEWTKYDSIADKIIPWISLWLFNYEIWRITGEWVGGGEHPEN